MRNTFISLLAILLLVLAFTADNARTHAAAASAPEDTVDVLGRHSFAKRSDQLEQASERVASVDSSGTGAATGHSTTARDRATRHLARTMEKLLTEDETRRRFVAANAVDRLLESARLNPRKVKLDDAGTRELESLLEPLHRELVDARLLAHAVTTESLMMAVAKREYVTIPRARQGDVHKLVTKHFGKLPNGEFNAHVLPDNDSSKSRLITLAKSRYPDYHASGAMVDELNRRRVKVVRAFLARR